MAISEARKTNDFIPQASLDQDLENAILGLKTTLENVPPLGDQKTEAEADLASVVYKSLGFLEENEKTVAELVEQFKSETKIADQLNETKIKAQSKMEEIDINNISLDNVSLIIEHSTHYKISIKCSEAIDGLYNGNLGNLQEFSIDQTLIDEFNQMVTAMKKITEQATVLTSSLNNLLKIQF